MDKNKGNEDLKDAFCDRSVLLAAAASLTALSVQPATAWEGHSCSFLCSRLRRQIQNLVSFSQVIQARHIVISDHKPICQNVKSQVKSKPSSYLFSLCKTLSDLAESFRHNHFNLHVTSHGRLRSSTVAVKVLLCFLTMSCIDLMLSQIATISSYFLSALVRKTEPSRNPSMGNAKIIFPEIKFIIETPT